MNFLVKKAYFLRVFGINPHHMTLKISVIPKIQPFSLLIYNKIANIFKISTVKTCSHE